MKDQVSTVTQGSMSDRPRSSGKSFQQVLDEDRYPVPEVLRLSSDEEFDEAQVPAEYYLSQEQHSLEVEKIWRRTWQFACREEQIPNVGDTEVYDIAGISILIVRSDVDEINAFYNVCLHRGRTLRDRGGSATEFRCLFHGFCWKLDGELKSVPSKWDFPELDPARFNLGKVQVGRWGGFVFINMDPQAVPFEEFIGNMPEHFAHAPLEDRYTEVHVSKIIRCNWKVAQEAFLEALHTNATHPQMAWWSGDEGSQYDAWGNYSRAITPQGLPSPHLKISPTEQEVFNAILDLGRDEEPPILVGGGMGPRQLVATATRERMRSVLGDKVDSICDSEMVDAFYFLLFPNFHPWGAYNRVVYRFRPCGNDPEQSIFEVYFLSPFTGERPPPAKVHELGPDDSFLDAPELGLFARVFEQDASNLPRVQIGLHSLAAQGRSVQLAKYQELKLRHFYHLYTNALKD